MSNVNVKTHSNYKWTILPLHSTDLSNFIRCVKYLITFSVYSFAFLCVYTFMAVAAGWKELLNKTNCPMPRNELRGAPFCTADWVQVVLMHASVKVISTFDVV